ncbi:hypothetical protein FACS1894172_13960 [Spirochaetia bacterium]|nr:hypothetical protein FACS1894164_03130 [Spirochaetia bacterium]GHU34132.1 hypothetical protein FACS1894172_13960 [Spirochaetia bacterium]
MTKFYSFPRGGIQFEDPTAPPRTGSVIAFLPNFSVIPLNYDAEHRVSSLVSEGDAVREASLISRAEGPGSANIYAPVPGTVVRSVSWNAGESGITEAFIISMKGSFDLLGKPEREFPWENLEPDALKSLISEYGVVEMELTGKPLADVLNDYEPESTLVIRCVFDDPWRAADYVLCHEKVSAVAEGAVITYQAVQAQKIVYACSAPEYELGEALLAETKKFGVPAFLAPVGSRYPQSNPRELTLALTEYSKKEQVALRNLLIENPSTMAAVCDAVKFRRPILDRYVAVGGSAIRKPSVLRVRIGTRIRELFAECGGFVDEPERIAVGSPLLGQSVVNLDEPVLKQTSAVFALLKRQIGGSAVKSCINCGECRSVCPVGLDPELLYKQITGKKKQKIDSRVLECHGCACCELVCPSRIPLATVIKGKNHETTN